MIFVRVLLLSNKNLNYKIFKSLHFKLGWKYKSVLIFVFYFMMLVTFAVIIYAFRGTSIQSTDFSGRTNITLAGRRASIIIFLARRIPKIKKITLSVNGKRLLEWGFLRATFVLSMIIRTRVGLHHANLVG